jgi:hypothetical protein
VGVGEGVGRMKEAGGLAPASMGVRNFGEFGFCGLRLA